MNARRQVILWLLGCGLVATTISRAADVIVLPDPTRPPNAVLKAMSAKSAGAGGGVSVAAVPGAQAASDAAGVASAPARPVKRDGRVSSVRVSPGYGNVALLDGLMVQVGDRVGDSTVASIDDDGVVLRGPKGLQRLSLTPAASKRWPGMESPAKGGGKETR